MLLSCMKALRGQLLYRSYSATRKHVVLSVNEDTEMATVSLDCPPVNALSLELLREISDAVEHLEKQGIAGMILTSSLPTIFSAGLQLTEMHKPDVVRLRAFWTSFQDMWLKLYAASFPTVAVVNGHSPAGGCLLAMSCDYRIMVNSTKYTIGISDTKIGLPVPPWVASTMTAVIGQRQAELALTSSRLFHVDKALEVGLIDEVAVDKQEGIQKAEAWLETMAQIPPQAHKLTKLSLREERLVWMRENRDQDLERSVALFTMSDFQQNLDKYLDLLKQRKKK